MKVDFSIELKEWHWILGDSDDREDLCLHGTVEVRIGKRAIEDDCCVSPSALIFLRALTDDHEHHTGDDRGNQFLPCDGHFMLAADEGLKSVEIIGSPFGTDWTLRHEGDKVRMTFTDGEEAVDMTTFERAVFAFVDRVEAVYQGCSPKKPRTAMNKA